MTTEAQCTNTVFVVRPCRCQANPETAASNAFQADRPWADHEASNRLAQTQFDACVGVLERAGVGCIVFDDTPEPHTPDSIFPNNWISTHADGTVVLYPMEAPSRRRERREDVLDALREDHGFAIGAVFDLSPHEDDGRYLEGTGSLVLDRANHVAFACRSSRTHEAVLDAFAARMGYTPVLFDSVDAHGQAIYHTNVMMCVGTSIAVVCVEAVDPAHRDALLERLAPGRNVVPITRDQMQRFAGNMLELKAGDGERLLVMSSQARASLTDDQLGELARHVRLVDAPIPSIEEASGGSVRCKMAEIFLPKREQP